MDHERRSWRRELFTGIGLLAAFGVWTMLIQLVDVQAAGPDRRRISSAVPGCNQARKLFCRSFVVLQKNAGFFMNKITDDFFDAPAAGITEHFPLIDVVLLKGVLVNGAVF